MTALMIAAFHGDIELVDSLLENGAQWNALDDAQKTAGDHARSAGHSEVDFLSLVSVCFYLIYDSDEII